MKRIIGFSILLAIASANTTLFATVDSPIRMRFGLYEAPSPGSAFSLYCTLSTYIDTAITASASLQFGPWFVNPVGSTTVEIEEIITDGLPYVHHERLTAQQAGTYKAEGLMWTLLDSMNVPGSGDLIFIKVHADPDSAGGNVPSGEISANGSIYSVMTPTILQLTYKSPVYQPMETVPIDSIPNQGEGNDSIYGGPDEASGTVTVTGQFVYTDPDGQQQPMVNATVEIWDSDNILCGGDDLLGLGLTDSNGEYSVTVGNGDCSGTVDVYVVGLPENSRVRIRDRDVAGNTYQYRFTTGTWDDAGGGTINMGVFPVPDGTYSERAVWVFEWLNRAWIVLGQTTGYWMRLQYAYVGFTVDLALNSFGANFFCSSQAINISSSASQSFDICVHEYGHSVQHWFGDKTCGACDGDHFWATPNTLQCAMDEGFADFFPVALNDDQEFNWHENSSRNLEFPASELLGLSFDDALHTEGNVAVSLYDIYDNNDEFDPNRVGSDQHSGGLTEILDVFSLNATAGGLATYWAKWDLTGNPTHFPVQALYYNRLNLNTPPAWTGFSNVLAEPFEEVIVDAKPHMNDLESSDTELDVDLNSQMSSEVLVEELSDNRFRFTILSQDGAGIDEITFVVTDGLVSQVSPSFRITWQDGASGGGGKGEEPNPCQGPCPMSQPKVLRTALLQNTPNPFNPATEIPVVLDETQHATLRIYDARGRIIATLLDKVMDEGIHRVRWPGVDDRGRQTATGIYFAVLEVKNQVFTRKLVLLK